MEEEEEEQTFYTITGNFNEWTDDRMEDGNVPGLYTAEIEVPQDGVLEFRFLMNGNSDQIICPAVDNCTRRSADIIGPEEGLNNKWLITANPGTDYTIELFIKDNKRSVMWVKS